MYTWNQYNIYVNYTSIKNKNIKLNFKKTNLQYWINSAVKGYLSTSITIQPDYWLLTHINNVIMDSNKYFWFS